ncbi:hypothetical protein D3C76_1108510 [compost metagenome]
MERVALDAGAADRGIQEAEVEAAVVPDQDRPLAAVGLDGLAHAAEDLVERLLLLHRHAQRVVQLDAGELQRGRFDVGAFERFDAEEIGVFRVQEALLVHRGGDRGDLQQGVGGAVEAAGLDVHHYRQVAAETFGHRMARARREVAVELVFVLFLAHAPASSRRQRSVSPARSGISSCSPS